jgi:hypothetical protein
MMPIGENFTCQKIAIDFTMPDGSITSLETRVFEREVAMQTF